MCGFAGFTYQNEILLENISQTLESRAIDEQYRYSEEWLSFCHAHLKISDLDKDTSQPLISEDTTIGLVWEIYNKAYLLSLIWIILWEDTYTELQTIQLCYEALWEDFIHYVNWEFAIFIFDKTKNEYLLFRDRWGVNNAYYRVHNNQFYFASEMKSLILDIPKINKDSMIEHMTFQFGISPNTILEEIYSLRPGTYLKYTTEKYEIKSFKDYIPQDKNNSIIEAIENSIIRRIPKFQDRLFLSLSGWPDSNLILYFLTQHYKGQIIAYSFCTDENKPEIKYAVENAKKLWIQHILIDMNNYEYEDNKQNIYMHEGLVRLPNVFKILKQQYPEYNDIKVELSWDGKEELILSNNHYPYKEILTTYQYFKSKDQIKDFDITQEFLNKEMFDYNLQYIDKATLRNWVERRMPFTDYELLKFYKYKNYRNEAESFLNTKWMEIVPGEFWFNVWIKNRYLSHKEIAETSQIFLQTLTVLNEK